MKYSLHILSLSLLATGAAYGQSTGPITTERLTITGAGSTGDVSGMSVAPNTAAASGTLAKLIADKAPLAAPTFTGHTTVSGTLEVSSNNISPPRDTFSINQIYTTNVGPNTASGIGQTYISSATNPNFDAAETIIASFNGTHPTNTQSKLGQFMQVASPPMPTSGNVGAVVAEWNLTNRGADTGYQASISSPNTYGGTVPLQQVGGLNLVPEGNFNSASNVGTNVTYGVMVSPSSNASTRAGSDFPRTYTAYGTDRNALVPTAKGVGGEGGRFFSAWGGETAALAPSSVGQAWGFWTHGIDLSRATFAANDPVRVKRDQAIVWTDDAGAALAALSADGAGVLSLANAAGTRTRLSPGGAWATYIPAYTFPAGTTGASVTHHRASYEIVGKRLTMQARFQVSWTGSAPGSLQVSMPNGVTLKDAAAGSFANISAGGIGYAIGTQGQNTITVGNTTAFGASTSFLTVSFTAEID